MGFVEASAALQDAVVPLFEPAHDHVHGPFPETDEAVPTLQRLVVGAEERDVPFDEPQTPFMGVTVVLKDAVAERACVIETLQVVWVPVQEPDQPAKVAPECGVAWRVTWVFAVKVSEQSVPQVMPVPVMEPEPETAVVRVYVVGVGDEEPPPPPPPEVEVAVDLKYAVAVLFMFMVSVHVVRDPLHEPDQRLKVTPDAGEAVRVTRASFGKTNAQEDELHV